MRIIKRAPASLLCISGGKELTRRCKKSEALKKINEADLLTIDGFGLGTLTAQEQSLVFEITKSRADNLSTIIVS